MVRPLFSLPSFAKINWDLRILGKRDDGYHELFTIFQTISLKDEISFSPASELMLTCSDPRIPIDDSNLIIRAAEALRTRLNITSGAKLHLEKNIPSPGGLGGGSSNAATALIGLSRLWQKEFDHTTFKNIATGLGSDVPFFFVGGTAIGSGRGEVVSGVRDQEVKCMLVVTPDVKVPTAQAYAAFAANGLTSDDPNRILQICRSNAESPDLLSAALKNDLEPIVEKAFPEIARVRRTLLDLGAERAMLCGSGPSVYAMFDKKETRQTALKALDIESTWRKFAVATISRSEYREALQLVY